MLNLFNIFNFIVFVNNNLPFLFYLINCIGFSVFNHLVSRQFFIVIFNKIIFNLYLIFKIVSFILIKLWTWFSFKICNFFFKIIIVWKIHLNKISSLWYMLKIQVNIILPHRLHVIYLFILNSLVISFVK